jgi:hypothetical protein
MQLSRSRFAASLPLLAQILIVHNARLATLHDMKTAQAGV